MNGLELKVLRVRARLTQWDLALRSGLHPSRISEMERDHRPVADAVVKLLDDLLQPAAAGEVPE